MNQRRGVRWSATKAFLRPVLHRPNLTVMTHAHVETRALEARDGAKRASGVEVLPSARRQALRRRRAAKCCWPPARSARRSSCSSRASAPVRCCAARHTVDARAARRGREPARSPADPHGVQGAQRRHAEPARQFSCWASAAMALEYLLFRTGPLTMPPSQLGAFAKSDPSQPSANIEWHVQPLSLDKFGEPAASLPRHHALGVQPAAHSAAAMCASSPPIPLAYPAIRLNYLSTPEDRQVAVDSMRFTRRIMAAKALGQVRAGGVEARPRRAVRRRAAARRRRARDDHFPPGGNLQDGATTRRRWWTTACACTASTGCGSSMRP